MKTLKTVGIVLALLFIIVATVEATDLYTASLYCVDKDVFYCSIFNVGTADKTVRVRIIDYNGIVIEDSGEYVLEPGHGADWHVDNNYGNFHCRFTVSGPKTQVRASAQIRPTHSTTGTATLAAE